MPLYIFARLEPLPEKELHLRDELERVLPPTRAEPGCLRIHLYESTRGPLILLHPLGVGRRSGFRGARPDCRTPQRFAAAAGALIAQPLRAVRTHRVA